MLDRLRWAFSNRVVATGITCEQVGYFPAGSFVKIGSELRRVHRVDNAALILYIY